jgi:hypothetical protein
MSKQTQHTPPTPQKKPQDHHLCVSGRAYGKAQQSKLCPYFAPVYDIKYLLTAIGLSPGGSTHLHTNNTQNNTNNRTTQIKTNVEESGPCPVFASFTLAFALQLRKNHGKTSVRVRKTSVRLRKPSVRVECI